MLSKEELADMHAYPRAVRQVTPSMLAKFLAASMVTKLEASLRREVAVGKTARIVTISPDGLKLVLKGMRKGFEVEWTALVRGDAAMAVAFRASLSLAKPEAKIRSRSTPAKK